MEIDDQEIRRGGVSSRSTPCARIRRFPGAELFCLIGGDQPAQLPKWREAGELARLAQFLIIPRPGEAVTALAAPFRGLVLRGFPLDISSSEIRRQIVGPFALGAPRARCGGGGDQE